MLAVKHSSEEPEQRDFAELEARYLQIVSEQKRQLEMHKGPVQYVVDITLWQRLNIRISMLLQNIWRHRVPISLAGGGALAAIILFAIIYMFFEPQSIGFAFAQSKNCVASPLVFPSLFKTDSRETFVLKRKASVSMGHTAIFSSQVCAIPTLHPLPLTSYTDHQWVSLGGLHIGKLIRIVTPGYPIAYEGNLGDKAIPIEKPIIFKLNTTDATFNYSVDIAGKTAACAKQNTTLSCSLIPLKLAYDEKYNASLVREFRGQTVGTVFSKAVKTITATAITQTSINPGSTVYNKPQQITIGTSKTITKLQGVSLTAKNANGTTTAIPITSSFKGQSITVSFVDVLSRETAFDLHIDNLTASDDSTLEQPYDLPFTTSGGPKVTSSNIPSFGLTSGQAMVVTFDQVLGPSQDPSQLASLLVNGVKQSAAITLSGQRLTIQPSSSYPVCANVTVQLTADAQNIYGVSGNSTWSYTSRSHCYTTYSIGTSVKGRPITAYQFGNGSSMVLYIAAMEGNEQNSANLLQQWIPDIDANPGKIPSYRTLVVIPQINPDGYAADTRLNADGIDLNRNFPSNNWQTQVTEPLADTVWTNDGGPYPLSEPESRALANFYEAHKPRLTLTMHSHGGIVEANDAGDSIALGTKYASLADYRAIPTYAIGNFFDYTTTGAFEDWANDKFGLPVLEVELESATADEYSRNLPALWAMAQVAP